MKNLKQALAVNKGVERADHPGRINGTGQLVEEIQKEGSVKDKGQVGYVVSGTTGTPWRDPDFEGTDALRFGSIGVEGLRENLAKNVQEAIEMKM